MQIPIKPEDYQDGIGNEANNDFDDNTRNNHTNESENTLKIRDFPEKNWPLSLRNIPDKPSKLFIKGADINLNYKFLTVIGPRKNSLYGKEVIDFLISGLRNYPIYIVSGLAIGIDAYAHQKSIENNLRTIAFPGSSLDDKSIYPRSNFSLSQKILENNGSLISEFPENSSTKNYYFPMRNRLMAGISDAVLIIEAAEKSGSLITARLALEYNRDVLTVPNSIFNPNSRGSNNLIQRGAYVINNPNDILEILGLENLNTNNDTQNLLNIKLEKNEEIIFKILDTENNIDKIREKSSLNQNIFNQNLTSLELKNLISIQNNHIFKKI